MLSFASPLSQFLDPSPATVLHASHDAFAFHGSRYTPHHSEIIVLVGSLCTCDPGDIHQTIQSLANNRIRCSVISLAVEVFVYRALAQLTQGSFHVILDELHLKTVMKDLVPPPVASAETDATLIRMGFPHSETFDLDRFSTKRCICHLNALGSGVDSGHGTSTHPQYACPRCRAAYCELPIECTVCGLTLVAAPHLARAYHHLFPLENFETVPPRDSSSSSKDVTAKTTTSSSGDSDEVWCSGCAIRLPRTLPVSWLVYYH
ncbi:putative rna polymerase ii transcription initiation/nucleotide excision repair factor tfiih [Fasciola hepatica]|uniref:Rna polymerase ii transcription initiation/nucleotide excision repair factor tfiih n=1 Tax=Fasciola hepatica TaxID=6192 RepID=A0A4E0RC73_FASHE|nr:putative rna polymerase ii transcription initiation/nucleotide excision repair factor tfiih [Fasciola hepatica]